MSKNSNIIILKKNIIHNYFFKNASTRNFNITL